MVNVDDALRIAVHEIVGQNLHVAGQNHEVRVVLVDQAAKACLGFVFVPLGDGNNFIWNAVKIGDGLVVRVIGNDQRDVTGEFASFMPVQQIHQAVIVFRDENNHALALG